MGKTSIKVFVRLRPAVHSSECLVVQDDRTISVLSRKKDTRSGALSSQLQESTQFRFDSVLQGSSQEGVFTQCAQEVAESVINGYNGTIFAYGQTGSGKTYTMVGDPRIFPQRGVIPRAIHHVFQEADSKPEGSITIRVSYLEIYSECMYDMLADPPGGGDGLVVVEDQNGNVDVRGLTKCPVSTEAGALERFFEGEMSRSTAVHTMNEASSRSHCIFTIYVEARTQGGGGSSSSSDRMTVSKLHLVDLAGSERLKKTQAVGHTLREATAINKSLTFLEQTVNSLAKGQSHVSFRQTKLTAVLKDALGGNCKTVMVGCCWLEDCYLEETVSTLRFAMRVKSLTTNAVVNEKSDPAILMRRMERQVEELKRELAMKDTLTGKGRVSYEDYTDAERRELGGKVKAYLRGEEGVDSIPIDSIKQVKEAYALFKDNCATMKAELEQQLAACKKGKEDVQLKALNMFESVKVKAGAAAADDGAVGELDKTGTQGFHVGEAPANARPLDASYSDRRTVPQSGSRGPAPLSSRGGVTADDRGRRGEAGLTATRAEKKNEAFITFKKEEEEGKVLDGLLKEKQARVREARQAVRDVTASVNQSKQEIDRLKGSLEAKHAQKPRDPAPAAQPAGDDGEPIDEEEFLILQQIKDAKLAYRKAFDELRGIKASLENLDLEVAEVRQNVVDSFNQWYAKQPGGEDDGMARAMGSGPSGDEDGTEMAEREEMDHLFQADPESSAFFSARKQAAATRRFGHHTGRDGTKRQAAVNGRTQNSVHIF